MIVRGPTVATLAAGLATLVGYCDTLGVLTVISYLTKATQPNNAALGVLSFVVTIIGPALMLVVAFVSGVVAGSLLGHWAGDRRRQAVLSFVTLLFTAAALLDGLSETGPGLILMVLALGALNAVLEDLPDISIGFFELLGRFGKRLSRALAGEQSLGLAAAIGNLVVMIVSICGGVLLYSRFGLASLWLAALAAGLLASWSTISKPEAEI
jgi:uncharacterized membrane protein YoaK (UPF0700 family)